MYSCVRHNLNYACISCSGSDINSVNNLLLFILNLFLLNKKLCAGSNVKENEKMKFEKKILKLHAGSNVKENEKMKFEKKILKLILHFIFFFIFL